MALYRQTAVKDVEMEEYGEGEYHYYTTLMARHNLEALPLAHTYDL